MSRCAYSYSAPPPLPSDPPPKPPSSVVPSAASHAASAPNENPPSDAGVDIPAMANASITATGSQIHPTSAKSAYPADSDSEPRLFRMASVSVRIRCCHSRARTVGNGHAGLPNSGFPKWPILRFTTSVVCGWSQPPYARVPSGNAFLYSTSNQSAIGFPSRFMRFMKPKKPAASSSIAFFSSNHASSSATRFFSCSPWGYAQP